MFLSGSVTICDSASEMCELAAARKRRPENTALPALTYNAAEPYGRILTDESYALSGPML
jgi:hypothetical protein